MKTLKSKLFVAIVLGSILTAALASIAVAAPFRFSPERQTPVTLSPELLAIVLGGFLSLLTTYVPKFRTWFAGLAEDVKMASMGIATILIGIAVYTLACTPSLGFPFVVCPSGGVWELLAIIFLALGSNQGVDRVSPEPRDVKAAKAAQKAKAAS